MGDGWNGGSITLAGETFALTAGGSGTGSIGACTFVCDFSEVSISVQNGEGTDFGFSITGPEGSVVMR